MRAGMPLGLYLHVPFCEARCSYCAFVTWTDRAEQQSAYFAALRREIVTRCAGAVFDTVYFGGGTPSLPDPREIASTLDAIRGVASIAAAAEVTLEANPESVDGSRADAWLHAGVNRVSLGVQSFDPAVLAAANRLHSPEGPGSAVRALREAGIANLSVDLIAGLPHETAESLRESRLRAVDLAPDHVSLYLLELDEAGKSSPLAAAVRAGRVRTASDDELADWWEESCADLEAAGLPRYEISNFARPGRASRHNLKYWRCEPFLACGVAAHWHGPDRVRRFNLAGFEAWLARVELHGEAEAPESRDEATGDLAAERVMLGLRLVEGVDLDAVEREHPGSRARFEPVLREHAGAGLACVDASRATLTARGALLSNEVFADLLATRAAGVAP